MRFKARRGGAVTAVADEVEAAVLRHATTDLLELLGGGTAPPAGQDPLAALVGLPSADAALPEDPALARLLPDAYGDDDADAAREFRRYTEADLRAGKRAHCRTVLATLPEGGGQVVLDRNGADAWLGCLNDLRLVLGTRLDVTEELDVDDLDEDDPRTGALHLYGWLGWLQESLLQVVTPRR